MKALGYLVPMLFAWVFAAFETAVFYGIVDLFWGYEVTWPLALAVGFCINSAQYDHLRDSWRREFE